MAFKDTFLFCVDNSGVVLVKCIKVYKQFLISPGSLILVTLKKVLPNRKVKSGQLYKAVVVRMVKPFTRFDSMSVRYFVNAVVLLKKNELVPLGTRIYGSVFFEIRKKGFLKIASLSLFLL